MCFQAIVAALVYLASICNGLTSGYSAILLPQLRANSSGFEADEDVEPWIGNSRDLFHLYFQVILLSIGKLQLEKILIACMRRSMDFVHNIFIQNEIKK
jgi:hypothetical protein